MPDHFLGVADAQTVNTRAFALTAVAMADLAVEHAMGVVWGDSGHGKTFAVQHAARALPGDIAVVSIEFESRPGLRLIADDLLHALVGVRHRERASRYAIGRELRAVLADRRWLVIVDEAQRLGPECHEYLRHLHDDPASRFALLFVGGNMCRETLAARPMLDTRLFRDVRFQRIPGEEVTQTLRAFHPIWQATEPEIIETIDERFAHGVWRHWASFTKTATSLCARAGLEGVDEEVVATAFALLPTSGVGPLKRDAPTVARERQRRGR